MDDELSHLVRIRGEEALALLDRCDEISNEAELPLVDISPAVGRFSPDKDTPKCGIIKTF